MNQKFGINIESLMEYEKTIKKDETLTDILLPHNISYVVINEIVQKSKQVFDLSRIRYGNEYIIYSQIDSSEVVKYFIYEINPIEYVIVELTDSIKIYNWEKEVTKIERRAAGIIEYSLYATLKNCGLDDQLALNLADIFSWQIDFYSIYKGDKFKVIFEEVYADNDFIGIGNVSTALFVHRGKEYYAFRFAQNGEEEYFDENGNSLHREFLRAPLKFSRISSNYSYRRYHPILKIYRPHRGIDYAAPSGTPVQAIGDGSVVEARYKGQSGNFIKIKHNSVYSSGYLHLRRIGKGIYPGKFVKQGDIIGHVGSTGLSTGPHLDFRFWKNGELVNFLKMDFPPSYPVKEEFLSDYTELITHLKMHLENVTFAVSDTLLALNM
ncbi:peptidoglycan DD-metalloendopeptidase family protein [Bacteroidota bacterium]